ncbi:MAG: RecX family transcriptional regulator [Candidatus Izemoplasmatales bacterium]|nr:RecX family transcriptional regulator [Candidatus Izemoplasmatales bacterium]
MPRVKMLKREKKQYRVSLETNEEVKEYVVSEDLVLTYRLLKGTVIEGDRYHHFIEDVRLDPTIQKAKRILQHALKSTQEIHDYLTIQGVVPADQLRIIDTLVASSLLDDCRAIHHLVESAFQMKRQGPERIRFDLLRRGFGEADVNRELYSLKPEAIHQNLEILFSHKIASLRSGSVRGRKMKMQQFLLQKGYSLHDILEVMQAHDDLFESMIDNMIALEQDYQRIKRNLSRRTLDPKDMSRKITERLLSKGYDYHAIKKMLEKETDDGLSDE